MVSEVFIDRKIILFLGMVFLFCFGCTQQSGQQQADSPGKIITKFPQDWEGTWAGTLVITKQTGDTTQVPMQLHIIKQDTSAGWDWKIIYGTDDSGIRNYELYEKNAAEGHYVIDEKNSILLDAFYVGDTFYSRFQVSNNFIFTSTKMVGELLEYEITSGGGSHISFSGSEGNIPIVKSYNVTVQQKAMLSRM